MRRDRHLRAYSHDNADQQVDGDLALIVVNDARNTRSGDMQ